MTKREKERDREMTEEKLINALGELIAENGFEKLGVNKVAERAGLSKNLIYRYFESLDGLIYAYMKKHDFWVNAPMEIPDVSDLKGYLKKFIRKQINQFRENIAIRRIRRWDLSSDSDIIKNIRAQREKNGVNFLEIISQFSKINKDEVKAIAALVNAGISYLVIFEEKCQMYNGIDIQSDQGWEQIALGVDKLIDIMIE